MSEVTGLKNQGMSQSPAAGGGKEWILPYKLLRDCHSKRISEFCPPEIQGIKSSIILSQKHFGNFSETNTICLNTIDLENVMKD